MYVIEHGRSVVETLPLTTSRSEIPISLATSLSSRLDEFFRSLVTSIFEPRRTGATPKKGDTPIKSPDRLVLLVDPRKVLWLQTWNGVRLISSDGPLPWVHSHKNLSGHPVTLRDDPDSRWPISYDCRLQVPRREDFHRGRYGPVLPWNECPSTRGRR